MTAANNHGSAAAAATAAATATAPASPTSGQASDEIRAGRKAKLPKAKRGLLKAGSFLHDSSRRAMDIIHRLLVTLGNLAKYKDYTIANRSGRVANRKMAIEYYNAAREIAPDSGLPWNKLAVVTMGRKSWAGEVKNIYFLYRR